MIYYDGKFERRGKKKKNLSAWRDSNTLPLDQEASVLP